MTSLSWFFLICFNVLVFEFPKGIIYNFFCHLFFALFLISCILWLYFHFAKNMYFYFETRLKLTAFTKFVCLCALVRVRQINHLLLFFSTSNLSRSWLAMMICSIPCYDFFQYRKQVAFDFLQIKLKNSFPLAFILLISISLVLL